jgi:hypothetical protein
MRFSPVMRAARACAAATLVFSLSFAPSYARMGGSGAAFARPAFGGGHFSRFAPRGFNRGFDFNRFGFNRFGPSRFDHFGFNGFNRFGPNRFDRFGFNRFGPNRFGFNRFGFNRFNRFGSNRFDGNQLAIGGGWGGWGWGGVPASTGASEPIIVGDGAPVIINVGAGYGGGCVIHKLLYDSNGKFVGERQSPQC